MWGDYLTRLVKQYEDLGNNRVMAALIVHDLELRAGEMIETSKNLPPELRELYARLAENHPWGRYMWSAPVGEAIFPDERGTYDMVSQDRDMDEFVRNLLEHDIPIGMGAILWNDRKPPPRHVVAIAMLRSGDPRAGDFFTDEEKALFECQIPVLVKDIQEHERVKALRSAL